MTSELLNEYYETVPVPIKASLVTNLAALAAAIVLALVISNFVVINAKIPSVSMEATITAGDRVFGNRLAYLASSPGRGDVIIFKAPDEPKKLFVKRVIGLPGDTVEILDGSVYVNGVLLDEPYIAEKMDPNEAHYFEVPEGSYLCLGDNRNHSNDARYWNNRFVSRSSIVAKAWFRYYPSFKNVI